MRWLVAAAWGAFGGMAVELLELRASNVRNGQWPWRVPGNSGIGAFAFSMFVRVFIGGGLAAAMSAQFNGPSGAIAVGVAAPLIIEQIARQTPQPAPTGQLDRVAPIAHPAPVDPALRLGPNVLETETGETDGR